MALAPTAGPVRLALDHLKPNPENPRRIADREFKALCKSLSNDPDLLVARPCVALTDGTVIMGNMRFLAAKALKWPDIPVVVVDLDAAAARRWMVLDNNSYGEWEETALAEILWRMKHEDAVDLDSLGFRDRDLERMGMMQESMGGYGMSDGLGGATVEVVIPLEVEDDAQALAARLNNEGYAARVSVRIDKPSPGQQQASASARGRGKRGAA